MLKKSIIIIGAGVAGLCTGIYGQMNGYQTRIIEKHRIPGGLVTAWKRKGYLIDLCVQSLAGSGPGIFVHRYWNEIGILEGREFLYHDRYSVHHSRDGRVFNLYCDPDRLEKHMLEISPQDAPAIHEFVEGVRFGQRFHAPEMEHYEASTLGWMKFIFSMMPLMGGLQKWGKLTLGDLAARFQDPFLRESLANTLTPEFSALYAFATFGFIAKKQEGYPVGGSLPLVHHMENRYQDLGGQVQYRSAVRKILVKDNRAVGVQLEDGSEQLADVVISAGDGYSTIFELLEGKYTDDGIRKRYRSWKPIPAMVYASVGVNRTFPDLVQSVIGNAFELSTPLTIAGKLRTRLNVYVFSQEPNYAPEGKTVLTSHIESDYDYWQPFLADKEAYEAEKAKIAQAYKAALEQIWPGISTQVEMCNIATPLTFERFTGNWKASYLGWKLTREQAGVAIPKTLPGLDNFWMVGHWVQPGGGLPAGVTTARQVIWQQSRKDGKKFVTSLS